MYPLQSNSLAPLNQWYVAALSEEIGRDPTERWLLGKPVAMYRREDGTPVALDGRCPHRSYPLGRSRTVGDDIECGYHGIRFRPDGSCASIPSQTIVPRTCRVASYPIVERWKWLWIWLGDPTLADETKIVDHFEIGLIDPSCRPHGPAHHSVPGRYMLLHDNLLDLNHINFLHQNTIGVQGVDDILPAIEAGEDWIQTLYSFKSVPCPTFHGGIFNYTGPVDRQFGIRFQAPCLHVGFDEYSTPSVDGVAGKAIGALRVYHAITPSKVDSSHYFFAVTVRSEDQASQMEEGLLEGLSAVILEDISAARDIEALIGKLPGDPTELLLRADEACVRGRRMMDRLIGAEA